MEYKRQKPFSKTAIDKPLLKTQTLKILHLKHKQQIQQHKQL